MSASALPPTTPTTLVIMLGASDWPNSPGFQASQAFAHAARGFRDYVLDPQGFGLPAANLLDQFDVQASASEQLEVLGSFLEQRTQVLKAANQAVRDVLVYFVGHGGFAGPSADFYLLLRRTNARSLRASGMAIDALAEVLREKARQSRRYLLLDCCFAAAAFRSFQGGPDQTAITKTLDAFYVRSRSPGFSRKGTALLCSSDQKSPSLLLPDESCTMFSYALLHVLRNGDPHRPQRLSLRDLKELAEDRLAALPEKNAPRPGLHSPDQSEGDVADVPLFPNPRAKEERHRLASAMLTTLSVSRQLKRLHSPSLLAILLVVILLVAGSLGAYDAVTGNWPWRPSHGQSTPISTARATPSVLGQAWHAQDSGTSQDLSGVAWSGTQFVAVGGFGSSSTILTSPDGHHWTAQYPNISQDLTSVTWAGGQFVVVSIGGIILTSPDGHAWTAHNSGTTQPLLGIAGSDAPQYVAVGYSGTILTSSDGRIWTPQPSDTSQDLHGVAWSGTQFVAVGSSSIILTSPDGRRWFAEPVEAPQGLSGVTWAGAFFVAVGGSGIILTSPDGRTWTTQHHSSSSQDIINVAWSRTLIVAVGWNGIIFTSLNGRIWTAQRSGTNAPLYSVAWSGTQFVAVGLNGTILTSP